MTVAVTSQRDCQALPMSAGIGAVGSGFAKFFHRSKDIREKFGDNSKHRFGGVILLSRKKKHVIKRSRCVTHTQPTQKLGDWSWKPCKEVLQPASVEPAEL